MSHGRALVNSLRMRMAPGEETGKTDERHSLNRAKACTGCAQDQVAFVVKGVSFTGLNL